MKNGEYEIRIDGHRAFVYAPYNSEFVSRMRQLGARWNASEKSWIINSLALTDVRSAMMEIYGQTDEVQAETVNVIITFNAEQSEYRNSYQMFGRIIARAFGRDSGAIIWDNVSFLNGAPSSGGSTKNWITKIPAGCVVKIYGVPRGLAEKEIVNLKNGITAQIESIEDFDRASLESEREMLMARIVEIDAILNRKQ